MSYVVACRVAGSGNVEPSDEGYKSNTHNCWCRDWGL